MRIKQILLLLLTLFVTNLSAQEKSMLTVDFGERVIQDYLSYYGTLQKKSKHYLPDTHFWFEDADTRQLVGGFLHSHIDSLATDTLFIICEEGAVTSNSYLNVTSGDTLLWLQTRWLEDCSRSFEAFKTPFLNAYSITYWEDLCKWDTTHISNPSKVVTCGGVHSYIVRMIYSDGQLISTGFCHHEPKAEYDVEWYHPEWVINLTSP